jgi:hypothetical protein
MTLIKIIFIGVLILFFIYLIHKILLLRQMKENRMVFTDAKFEGSIAPLDMVQATANGYPNFCANTAGTGW